MFQLSKNWKQEKYSSFHLWCHQQRNGKDKKYMLRLNQCHRIKIMLIKSENKSLWVCKTSGSQSANWCKSAAPGFKCWRHHMFASQISIVWASESINANREWTIRDPGDGNKGFCSWVVQNVHVLLPFVCLIIPIKFSSLRCHIEVHHFWMTLFGTTLTMDMSLCG